RRTRRSAPGAQSRARDVRASADREAVDVRARPTARVLRHADGSRDRARRGRGRLPLLVDRDGYREERPVPDARGGAARRDDLRGRRHRRIGERAERRVADALNGELAMRKLLPSRARFGAGLVAVAAAAAALPAFAASGLVDAARAGDASAAIAVLDDGADPNARSSDRTTALHWAVYHDAADLVKRLVDAGADVDVVNDYGASPLSEAALNGNAQIVGLLLDAGADPNLPGAHGQTPLMIAARGGHVDAARRLLDAGADPNA